MSSVYRCQQCGLHSRVQMATSAAPLETIHCPRCGGLARRGPELQASPADLVDVIVAHDGRTRELAGLTEAAGEEGATRRVEDDETRRDVSERGADKVGRPEPMPTTAHPTPVAPPSLAFGSSPKGGLPAVTALRTVEVGDPLAAEPAEPLEPRAPRLERAPEVGPAPVHSRTTRKYASVEGLGRAEAPAASPAAASSSPAAPPAASAWSSAAPPSSPAAPAAPAKPPASSPAPAATAPSQEPDWAAFSPPPTTAMPSYRDGAARHAPSPPPWTPAAPAATAYSPSWQSHGPYPPPPGAEQVGPAPPPPDRAVVSATPQGPMYTGPGRSALDSPGPAPYGRADSLGQVASETAFAGQQWDSAEPPYSPFDTAPDALPAGHPPGPPPEGYAGGKAWSSDVIQRALQASGYDPGSSSTPIPYGSPTSSLAPLPAGPRSLDVTPSPPLSAAVHVHVAPPQSPYAHEAPTAPRQVGYEPPTPAMPVQHLRPRRAGRSGPRTAVLLPRRRSRGLFIALLCVAVLSVGVVLGVLVYSGKHRRSEAPALTAVTYGADELERAEERAAMYGLHPVDPRPPFDAAFRVASVSDRSLALHLALRNTGSREIGFIQLTSSWLLVHDGPTLSVSDGGQPDRPISREAPLRPGESVNIRIEIPGAEPPPGAPRESFVWIQVVLADSELQVFYEGGIMIELPVDPGPV